MSIDSQEPKIEENQDIKEIMDLIDRLKGKLEDITPIKVNGLEMDKRMRLSSYLNEVETLVDEEFEK